MSRVGGEEVDRTQVLESEFADLADHFRADPAAGLDRWVHIENVDRIRAMCEKPGRLCWVTRVVGDRAYLQMP